jgi:pyruvate/2-oxoglutarate dehydrogenase complex dihydrolipoamide acyltransferase (E2) component
VVAAVDGQVVIQDRVTLTLSVDHRVVNGRYAAEFLAEIVREFESW